MNIAYYISSFGLGHTSRAIPIIQRLKAENKVFVKCTSLSMNSIRGNIQNQDNLFIFKKINDLWLKYRYSEPLIEESIDEAYTFYENLYEKIIDQEKKFIQNNKIDLIISDIAPFLDKVSKENNIPIIGISNFDWGVLFNHLYEKYPYRKLERISQRLSDSFESYDLQIALPLNKNLLTNKNRKKVGFYTKLATRNKQEIFKLLNLKNDLMTVFLSLGMSIDLPLETFKEIFLETDYQIVASNRNKIKNQSNFKFVPKGDFKVQDYISASDIFIGKPGWGSLSECYCFSIPAILIEFGENLEWQIMINEYINFKPNTSKISFSELNRKNLNRLIEKARNTEEIKIEEKYSKALKISNKTLNEIYNIISEF